MPIEHNASSELNKILKELNVSYTELQEPQPFLNVQEAFRTVTKVVDLLNQYYFAVHSTRDITDDQTYFEFVERFLQQLRMKLDRSQNEIAGPVREQIQRYTKLRVRAPEYAATVFTPTQYKALKETLAEIKQLAIAYDPKLEQATDTFMERVNRNVTVFEQVDPNALAANVEVINRGDFVDYLDSKIDLSKFQDPDKAFFDREIQGPSGRLFQAAKVLTNYTYDPEAALPQNIESDLKNIQQHIIVVYDNYRSTPEAELELNKLANLVQQMLHESRVLRLDGRPRGTGRQYRDLYLRPTKRPLRVGLSTDKQAAHNRIQGELEMMLGNFAFELDRAEEIGFKIAEAASTGEPLAKDIKPDDRTYLVNFRNRLSTYLDKQDDMMKLGFGNNLNQDDRNQLNAFIGEATRYVAWIDRLIGVAEPGRENNGNSSNTGAHYKLERPDADDISLWTARYREFFDEDPEGFVNFVIQSIEDLHRQDMAWDTREEFKKTRYAIPFTALRDVLRELETSSKEEVRLFFETRLSEYAKKIRIHILLISFMGPHGNSALGSAQFTELKNFFPDLDAVDFHWLRGNFLDRPNWIYADELRMAMNRMDTLMNEMPGPGDIGKLGYPLSPWMGVTGNYHIVLMNRMIKETTDPNATIAERWTFPTKQYKTWELEHIFRLAYVEFMILRGRVERLVDYLAVGASPPKLDELSEVLDDFPLAKELNLATKEVIEIGDICAGLKLDRHWLAKMFIKRRLATLIHTRQTHDKKYLNVKNILMIKNPDGSFRPRTMAEVNELDEKEINDMLREIANIDLEGKIESSEAFMRFRNLLRSMYVSEAKADWLGLKWKHHQMVADRNGSIVEKGDYLAPVMVTPYQMITGEMASYYAGQNFRLDSTYLVVHPEMVNFYKRVYETDPPNLKGGVGNHTEDVDALWKDFMDCLKFTSALRGASDHLTNWHFVTEALDYRLKVLFFTYKATYPDRDPTRVYDAEPIDRLKAEKPRVVSMVGRFREGILEVSGQMVGALKRAGYKDGVFVEELPVWDLHHPYDHHIHVDSLREYLLLLFTPEGPYRRQVWDEILTGPAKKQKIGSRAYGEYQRLVKDWGVPLHNRVNDSLMHSHGGGRDKAKEEQKGDVERSKSH